MAVHVTKKEDSLRTLKLACYVSVEIHHKGSAIMQHALEIMKVLKMF